MDRNEAEREARERLQALEFNQLRLRQFGLLTGEQFSAISASGTRMRRREFEDVEQMMVITNLLCL